MIDSIAIGREVRAHRRDRGLTQAELAEQAGVARSSIIDLEQGKSTIELRILIAVAAALRMDLTLSSNLRPSEALARARVDILQAAHTFLLEDVRVFGSAVRDDDSPDSDIDLLVRAPVGTHPGDLDAFQEAVERLTGFEVDVLSDRLQGAKYDRIRESAVPL